MGTVFLAQQSQPHRKVAVKVFLSASTLEPLQYMDFLVRFRHEMEAVASLEHPNILSIYEYGERDGFTYLVTPFVNGQSLEKVLKQQGKLPFPRIVNYLDQLATALDFAHEHGVLHRDVKPANILVTADDKLFLTDFALSKVMAEEQVTQVRQFRVGMLDYQSPEQVIGKEVDETADLYSLGAVLYHMVTGTAPFQGASLMEVAKQHLQSPPLSPTAKRIDLPVAAERAMLRALAKRRAARYPHAQDLANALRLALATAQTRPVRTQEDKLSHSNRTSADLFPPRSLSDPKPSTGILTTFNSEQASNQSSQAMHTKASTPAPLTDAFTANTKQVSNQSSQAMHTKASTSAPSTDAFISFNKPGMLAERKTDGEKTSNPLPEAHSNPTIPLQDTPVSLSQTTHPADKLALADAEQENTGTIIKLTGPAKIVNVPIAGQPGRYVTGLLPVLPATQQEDKEPPAGTSKKERLQEHFKVIGLALAALLVLSAGTFWFAYSHSSSTNKTRKGTIIVRTPDVGVTMTAQAIATANANIILSDPLTRNIYNWPISASGPITYVFKDGAYHITDNDDNRGAPAILPDLTLKSAFAYTLTMEEIKGDDTSVNNAFGMIMRASIQNKNGKAITTFYSFEVQNNAGGEYQLWKYDDSQGSSASFWKKLAFHAFGKEFHQGQGPKSINTFKIIANGKNFTLLVNGKQVWTVQDSSFASGGIGMLVNLKGTEVAFSNLKLTYT